MEVMKKQRKVHFTDTLVRKLFINKQLLREFVSEFVATMLFTATGICSNCTAVLSRNTAGNFVTQTLGWAMGVTFAIYIAGNVSGGHVNSAITVTYGLLGVKTWRQVVIYIIAQFFGAFFGNAIAFGIYYDSFQLYDGGLRQTVGANATAGLFTTFPQTFVSTPSAFANEVVATCVMLICIIAVTDKRNLPVPAFIFPLFAGFILILISCSLCYNNGCALNPAKDLAGRVFTSIAGWGGEVFSYRNYCWFWVPIVGPFCGGPIGAIIYKSTIGMHFPRELDAPTGRTVVHSSSSDVDDEHCDRSMSVVSNASLVHPDNCSKNSFVLT